MQAMGRKGNGEAPLRAIRDIPFAALDFESAGERPNEAGIPIQLGIAWMESLTPDPMSFYRSYLRAEQSITWAAKKIHGIGTEQLKDAPELRALWPEVNTRLRGRWLVAHGAGTEKRFLRIFPLHGFGPWIDTLTLSRRLLPGCASYALSDLAAEFSLEEEAMRLLPGFRWHEALSDALASLLLLRRMITIARIQDYPPEVLL
jgi:DNA polymerase-3 subunit epsilon